MFVHVQHTCGVKNDLILSFVNLRFCFGMCFQVDILDRVRCVESPFFLRYRHRARFQANVVEGRSKRIKAV